MTYHAGMLGFGMADREAHITCDGDCGALQVCLKSSGSPYAWFLNRKAPPNWKTIRIEDPFIRRDYCPVCKTKVKP